MDVQEKAGRQRPGTPTDQKLNCEPVNTKIVLIFNGRNIKVGFLLNGHLCEHDLNCFKSRKRFALNKIARLLS